MQGIQTGFLGLAAGEDIGNLLGGKQAASLEQAGTILECQFFRDRHIS
jgi:hypothetical protein